MQGLNLVGMIDYRKGQVFSLPYAKTKKDTLSLMWGICLIPANYELENQN